MTPHAQDVARARVIVRRLWDCRALPCTDCDQAEAIVAQALVGERERAVQALVALAAKTPPYEAGYLAGVGDGIQAIRGQGETT